MLGDPRRVSDLFPHTGAEWGVLVSAGSSVLAVAAMVAMAAREAVRRVERRRRSRSAA